MLPKIITSLQNPRIKHLRRLRDDQTHQQEFFLLEGRSVIEEALAKVKEEISAGKTIAVPLAQAKIFPSMVIQMINVGENTGTLDQMLIKIADFYEAEVEAVIAGMSKLIEPIVLVVLGGIVSFILIAMYLPVFNIAGAQEGM